MSTARSTGAHILYLANDVVFPGFLPCAYPSGVYTLCMDKHAHCFESACIQYFRRPKQVHVNVLTIYYFQYWNSGSHCSIELFIVRAAYLCLQEAA